MSQTGLYHGSKTIERYKWVPGEPGGKLVIINDDYHPHSPDHCNHYGKKSRRKIRLRLIKKDPHCHYCGRVVREDNSSLDHKVPRCRGGSNSQDNLVLCCLTCNNRKGDMSYEVFLELIRREIDV